MANNSSSDRYQSRVLEMKLLGAFFWGLLLLFLMTSLGCENTRTKQQLERIKTSFYEPHYYVVAHEGLHIGTYSRSASMTNNDEYEFRTTLTMPSANGITFATESVYEFQSRSPYRLSAATRTTRAVTKDRPYRVEQLDPVFNKDEKSQTQSTLKERYGLLNFFALELALMTNLESTDDKLESIETPFHEISSSTKWFIIGRSDHDINLSSTTGERATYSFEKGLPRLDELHDNTGLSMNRISVEEYVALDFRPPHVVENIRIPVDRLIESPESLSTLTVQFEFNNGESGPWASLLDASDTLTSTTQPNTSSFELIDWEGEFVESHTSDTLRSMVAKIIKETHDPHLVVDALVRYVNENITYTDWNTLQTVEETIAQKIGDCTEFSQLFTAMATAADFSARTVVGLAYQDSSRTFGIHAWNEVLFEDGTIRVVDPTWNQIRADATHIEFPPAYQHEIVRTLKNLRIKVLSVDYNSDPNA